MLRRLLSYWHLLYLHAGNIVDWCAAVPLFQLHMQWHHVVTQHVGKCYKSRPVFLESQLLNSHTLESYCWPLGALEPVGISPTFRISRFSHSQTWVFRSLTVCVVLQLIKPVIQPMPTGVTDAVQEIKCRCVGVMLNCPASFWKRPVGLTVSSSHLTG